jgi:hypothetical protein
LGPAVARAWGTGTGNNSGYSIDAVLAGGTLGLSWAVGENLRIIPEVSVYTTVAGHGMAIPGHVVRVSPDVGTGDPTFIQGGIGIAFGRTQ